MSRILCSAIALAVLASPVGAQRPVPRTAITSHVVTIGGRAVSYRAKVSETFVTDRTGKASASIVTTAYLRSDVPNSARRPVMFVFNGGPGASSSPLHMKALGPVVRLDDKPGGAAGDPYAANPDSPLDAVDLVFIDPVSTGFSRPLPGNDPAPFYDTIGDALEIAQVIERWLRDNHREASPRFLAGESYGTMRAPLIVKYAPALRWHGVLLISGGGELVGPHMAAVNTIPAMAAAAWYHRAVDRRGLSVAQFHARASAFARGAYRRALEQGDALLPAERHAVAVDLAALIGLPAAELEADGLRVTGDFTLRLLKGRGLRIGRLDTRVTGPLPRQAAASAIDDPSLGVVKPGQEAHATPESVGAVPSPVVGRYLTEQLHFPTSDTYIGVNFLANAKWTGMRTIERGATIMADAMKADPRLRLYAVSGYYDLGATDGAGFLQAGVPPARLRAIQLAGPHQVYDGDGARAAFARSVRAFVTAR